jgi:hypothetical protein
LLLPHPSKSYPSCPYVRHTIASKHNFPSFKPGAYLTSPCAGVRNIEGCMCCVRYVILMEYNCSLLHVDPSLHEHNIGLLYRSEAWLAGKPRIRQPHTASDGVTIDVCLLACSANPLTRIVARSSSRRGEQASRVQVYILTLHRGWKGYIASELGALEASVCAAYGYM